MLIRCGELRRGGGRLQNAAAYALGFVTCEKTCLIGSRKENMDTENFRWRAPATSAKAAIRLLDDHDPRSGLRSFGKAVVREFVGG